MLDGLRMAFGTLTTLPMPAPRMIDRRVAGHAMLLAPLAAVPLAAVAAVLVLAGDAAGLPPLAVAALAVGACALGSRGLHLDGLADTADGLAASYDRGRALDVMRRGDAGPSGVATLVFVLLLQCGAAAGIVASGHGPVVAVAVLASRCVLPVCCARGTPSARPEGLGATVAGAVPRLPAALAVLACAVGSVPIAAGGNLAWWRGPLAVLAGLVVACAVQARCVARLGGVTGDTLGGSVEAGMTGALLALAW